MRNSRQLSAAGLAAIAAAVALPPHSGATAASNGALGARSSSQAATAHPLHLKLHITSNVVVHNGIATAYTPATKFATGDSAYAAADILRGSTKVGREDISCGMTSPSVQLCTAVDHLPGGIITHVGASSLSAPTVTDTITGGAGRYIGVRGGVLTRFTSLTAATIDYAIVR